MEAFLVGLVGASLAMTSFGEAAVADVEASWSQILLADFLVGLGTRHASDCISGHPVRGISRGSIRSLVATLTFMVAGFLPALLQRQVNYRFAMDDERILVTLVELVSYHVDVDGQLAAFRDQGSVHQGDVPAWTILGALAWPILFVKIKAVATTRAA